MKCLIAINSWERQIINISMQTFSLKCQEYSISIRKKQYFLPVFNQNYIKNMLMSNGQCFYYKVISTLK